MNESNEPKKNRPVIEQFFAALDNVDTRIQALGERLEHQLAPIMMNADLEEEIDVGEDEELPVFFSQCRSMITQMNMHLNTIDAYLKRLVF